MGRKPFLKVIDISNLVEKWEPCAVVVAGRRCERLSDCECTDDDHSAVEVSVVCLQKRNISDR